MRPAEWELRDSKPFVAIEPARKAELTQALSRRIAESATPGDLWTPAQSVAALLVACVLLLTVAVYWLDQSGSLRPGARYDAATAALIKDSAKLPAGTAGTQKPASAYRSFSLPRFAVQDGLRVARENRRVLCALGLSSGPCPRGD